jgi:hypothetical protein
MVKNAFRRIWRKSRATFAYFFVNHADSPLLRFQFRLELAADVVRVELSLTSLSHFGFFVIKIVKFGLIRVYVGSNVSYYLHDLKFWFFSFKISFLLIKQYF